MKEYQVVEYSERRDLEIQVTALMSQGWKISGGVSVSVWVYDGETRSWYAQAMVK